MSCPALQQRCSRESATCKNLQQQLQRQQRRTKDFRASVSLAYGMDPAPRCLGAPIPFQLLLGASLARRKKLIPPVLAAPLRLRAACMEQRSAHVRSGPAQAAQAAFREHCRRRGQGTEGRVLQSSDPPGTAPFQSTSPGPAKAKPNPSEQRRGGRVSLSSVGRVVHLLLLLVLAAHGRVTDSTSLLSLSSILRPLPLAWPPRRVPWPSRFFCTTTSPSSSSSWTPPSPPSPTPDSDAGAFFSSPSRAPLLPSRPLLLSLPF